MPRNENLKLEDGRRNVGTKLETTIAAETHPRRREYNQPDMTDIDIDIVNARKDEVRMGFFHHLAPRRHRRLRQVQRLIVPGFDPDAVHIPHMASHYKTSGELPRARGLAELNHIVGPKGPRTGDDDRRSRR